jgi:hypothetical protein
VEQTDKRSLFACDRTRVRIAPGSPHFSMRSVWSVKDVRAALTGRDSAKDGVAVRANRARPAKSAPRTKAHARAGVLR